MLILMKWILYHYTKKTLFINDEFTYFITPIIQIIIQVLYFWIEISFNWIENNAIKSDLNKLFNVEKIWIKIN